MTAHRYLDVLNDVAQARAKARSANSAKSAPQNSQSAQNSRAQALASVLSALALLVALARRAASAEEAQLIGDLFFIYKSGHLMKLTCQKRENVGMSRSGEGVYS